MNDVRWRLAQGIFFQMTAEGGATAWLPTQQEFRTLTAEALALLQQFAAGRTAEEASIGAGFAYDRAAVEVVESLASIGLLVPLTAPAAPTPVRQGEPRAGALPRARIASLMDPESFQETDPHATGVVTGFGTIDGRPVAVAAYDSSQLGEGRELDGAALGAYVLEKITRLQEQVLRAPCPLLYLFDEIPMAGGADTDRFFVGPLSVGRIYRNQSALSGVVPQIGVVLGTAAMVNAFPVALCDVSVFVEPKGTAYVGGPRQVAKFTGETASSEDLGGARMHCDVSGLGDALARSEDEAVRWVRRYLEYMPTHSGAPPSIVGPHAPSVSRSPKRVVPEDDSQPFPLVELIDGFIDGDSSLPIKRSHAPEVVTLLARIEGIPVGIVGNDSSHKGGVLTVEACNKAARFISICDAFGIPLLFLLDTPGFAIGKKAERAGILRAAARVFSAIAEATVPRISLVVRKAHTAGVYAMCGPPFDPDAFLALSSAAISIYGLRATVPGYQQMLAGVPVEARRDLRQFLQAELTPGLFARRLVLEDVLAESEIRRELAWRLRRLVGTRREASRPGRAIQHL